MGKSFHSIGKVYIYHRILDLIDPNGVLKEITYNENTLESFKIKDPDKLLKDKTF